MKKIFNVYGDKLQNFAHTTNKQYFLHKVLKFMCIIFVLYIVCVERDDKFIKKKIVTWDIFLDVEKKNYVALSIKLKKKKIKSNQSSKPVTIWRL